MSPSSSSPAGDATDFIPDTAEWLSALARYVMDNRPRYIKLARRWMRRLGVDEIGLAPEGAVQRAWLKFQRRVEEGRLGLATIPGAFAAGFPRMVIRAIRDERRRQRAGKRDRARSVRFSELGGDGFDAIDPGAIPPEDAVSGEEQVRDLLDRLAGAEESLVDIAVMKRDGFTNREIAARLGRPIWAVKRSLERARSALESSEGSCCSAAGASR